MIVGLVVYFILFTVIKGANSAVQDVEETKYKNIEVDELLHGI